MMKTKLIFLFCLALPVFLMAQESKKLKEAGITFTDLSFNNLSVTFRTGTERSLWRFNSALFSGSNQALTNSSSSSDAGSTQRNRALSIGVGIGKEYRKKLDKKLEFRYGLDLKLNLSYSKLFDSQNRVSTRGTTYTPGFNLVLGFNYPVWKNIIFGVEMLPKLSYSVNTSKNYAYNSIDPNAYYTQTTKVKTFDYYLFNKTFVFSIIYRLETPQKK